MKKPRILLYDLETSPNLAYVWGKWKQDVIAYETEWQLLSVSWKWLGEERIHCVTAQGQPSDRQLVKLLWGLFNTADVVIAHNGDRFDQRKARARFLFYGLKPPSSFASVDTLKVAKKHFHLNSNRLDDIGKLLNVGRKVKHTGFDLWLGCLKGDPKSWALLERYNKQDVRLLERIYLKMLPWIDNHPNMALLKGRQGCPACGSHSIGKNGVRATTKSLQQRWRCNSCGCSYTTKRDSNGI